ncbi:MAG: hypothetical protein AUJ72_05030 [Candidatus Omnitrophica bacterium CG1_02_46_14]|nr:MAG: hypothetical protein AUJ72_05030 [Candidatus Omnitrophica bacterium CG1_02_46_14]
MRRFLVLVFLTIALGFPNEVFADNTPARCVITIKSVWLQKNSGEWAAIIEPDRLADLATEEPVISFFNDGRRVIPGNYRNFKITLLRTIKLTDGNGTHFLYEAPYDEILIYGKGDLKEFLKVKARSFVSVWFEWDLSGTVVYQDSKVSFLPPKKIKQITIVVDDHKVVISGENVLMVI